VRKFDCEAWIPTQGKYRELTSTSNCTSYQARRLDTRIRTDGGTEVVATLNGTLMAATRTIVALLENHQQADGSVRVPEILQPHLGGRTLLEPLGMSFTPKLLALDVDGTLVDFEDRMTDRVRSTVRAARESGLHVGDLHRAVDARCHGRRRHARLRRRARGRLQRRGGVLVLAGGDPLDR
jgi:hypothetical protein